MATSITYTPFTRSGSNVLPPNHYMSIGQFLLSPNGRYKLILQSDSNLALYDSDTAIWAANAEQPYSTEIYRQNYVETRFFVSNSTFLQDSLRARLWTASTGRYEEGLWYRSHLSVQDDGNIVTVDINAIFTTLNTTLLPNSDEVLIFPPGTALEQGRRYAIGDYFLIFQADGNLVVYSNDGGVLWHADTYNKGANQAVMQMDGNFVVYRADGVALWSTETAGNSGAYAQIQSNGAFVICNSTPLWARTGWTPGKAPKVFYPDRNVAGWKTYDRVLFTF